MVSKLANKYQIIQPCHNFKNILINKELSKSFVNIFYGAENNKTIKKDETINHSKVYLPFYLLWCQKSVSKNYAT